PKEMVEALAPVNPSDAAMSAADLFIAAKRPVILAAPSLYKAAANLALIKGETAAVPLEANAKGVVAMGMISGGKKFSDIITSSSKVLYVVGEIPVSKRPDTGFLVVQASHMTELAAQADIVLPSTPALESEGSIIDWLGRIKKVNRACEPAGDAKQNGDIFSAVAGALGAPLKPVKDTDIKKAAKAKEKVAFSAFKKDAGHDVDADTFMQETNKTTVNDSRLLWLKELETCAVTA
ncbi:MAG: molybdopterin-dependent oxidoreductase, partial [Nitrospirota bacterium]|nr:molybdopterin-dependent oxidoreductase [Nitrospirota bacterium]